MKNAYAILSLFFVVLVSRFAWSAEDDVLIQPPLSWSINSIRVVWSVSEGTTANETTRLIYSSEKSASEEEGSGRTGTVDSQTDRTTNVGGGVKGSAGLNSNPFELFGLLGAKVSASGFMETSRSYKSGQSSRSTDEWSETEKQTVAAAFTSSNEQSTARTVSNRKLVFTIDFVNHTASRLMFDPASANSVPVYCGGVHLGDAKLADERATIAATGKPIPCRFEMPLDDTGKMAILKKRPKMSIESGQLLIRSADNSREQVDDAIQESIVSGSYFTIALISQDLSAQWHIRWFRKSPVTLEEALEAINEQIRTENNDGERTLYRIEDDRLTQVCDVSLQPKKTDTWLVQAQCLKNTKSRDITDWSKELKSTPDRGCVYAFTFLDKRIADLTAEANSGNAQAQYDLAVCYETGDGVEKDLDEAKKWFSKAADRVVTTVNGVKFAFRFCPAGSFMMGSPESEEGRDDDETQHRVTLTKGFWMLETEVTQAQWKAVMGTTIEQQAQKMLHDDTEYNLGGKQTTIRDFYGFKRDEDPSEIVHGVGDSVPIYYVSWDECQEFCRKCKSRGLPIELPTEAQWEYACRAGSTTSLYNGNLVIKGKCNGPLLDSIAWYGGNSSQGFSQKSRWNSSSWPETQYSGGPCGAHIVGKKAPNDWGLYDMIGNVWEWCADYYNDDISSSSATDPKGPSSGSIRVFRGGSWYSDAQYCRSASRDGNTPTNRSSRLGFRVALGQ